ncbi:SDR family oxidoreductase [Leptothrix ochracea]|uniref:SDR family oxidoreductase n=1 Tax=Leptothrix ochracea TaxID=735331 RepID=UPI0034E25876
MTAIPEGVAPLVFLTGASSGIGQALALAYARQGWRLALVARRVESVRIWVEQAGIAAERVRIYAADVSDRQSIIAAAESCLNTWGVPEIVVACAGISHGIDTAERADLDVFEDLLQTNLLGLAATFHPFLAPMRVRQSGTLVGVASVAGIRGLPGHGGYCASKAGVISYCESLRMELAPHKVRVVTLLPGFIETPMTRGNPYPMPFLMPVDKFAEQALRAIAAGRAYRVIPWPMAWVVRLLRWAPAVLLDRVMGRRQRKPRKTSS